MLVVDLKTPLPQHRNLALSTSVAETPQRMNARERGEYKEVNPGIYRKAWYYFGFQNEKAHENEEKLGSYQAL